MKKTLCIVLALCGLARGAPAEEPAPPRAGATVAAQPNTEAFHDAKFGVFIHWGISSIPGKGEWVMANDGVPVAEYEGLLKKFNPEKFDAAQWVELFKAAGAKYVTLTAKHHDGFCLFDSKLTDYDVMSTPLERDVVKELTDACRASGLQVFYYYSISDWHHPHYWPWGWSGAGIPGRPRDGDNEKYIDYYQGQIRELCTNYGDIGGIWLDGQWDRAAQYFDLPKTYEIIHKLQPRALVGNNHHGAPAPGEDFQIVERGLPPNRIRDPFIPLETCDTIGSSWGYNVNDNERKSAKKLLRTLVTTAGSGGNLLLNTGPLPDGSIRPGHADVLREMGRWLTAHGKTIYGTRRGPWQPREWGVSTHKGNKAYLHFFVRPGDTALLPALPHKLLSARAFDGEEIAFEIAGDDDGGKEIAITLPEWDQAQTVDFIVGLTFEKPLDGLWVPLPIRPDRHGLLALSPDRAELHGESIEGRGGGWLWKNENDWLAWHVYVPPAAIPPANPPGAEPPAQAARAAPYHAFITYSCPEPTAGCEFTIGTERSRLIGKAEPTGKTWDEMDSIELPGIINLPAGSSAITIKASGRPPWAFMHLLGIELRPASVKKEGEQTGQAGED